MCEHEKDTLRPDLCQSLYLTRAAGERLSDHKEEVGVFYPLCVEQPMKDSDGGLASFMLCFQCSYLSTNMLQTHSADAPEKLTVSSFHSPAARCRSWWCL